ncbi:MAG: LamG domain-containing protein, partial [Bacteroidota bacterium]|nr:LamG domain-containing protein [Bacteroidota bacterium]
MKKAVLLRLFIGITFLAGQWAIAQIPEVTGLSLSATSNSTDANLIATYTTTGPIVDTATAWYKDLDPVALLYLPFEAGSTNALLDFSGSDNDASYSVNVLERPTWATAMGHNGSGAFFFDGGDHLDVGGILPLSSSYTKTAWINIATDANGFRNIISSVLNDANNHHFKIDPNGRLNAGHNFGESIVEDSDSINHDQWYFVAVTFDFNSGEMTLYRDGNEVDRAIVPEEFRAVADANVIIGAKNYGFEWQGYIDEPRLYGHVLSADQIETMYEGNDLIEPQETRGEEDWYCVVTPFSVSDVGTPVQSNTVTLQGPEITGLSLSSTSGDNLTTDDLTASYTPNARVRETASAWYRNGTPVNTLYLPFEADYPNVLQDFSGSENHVTRSMDQDSVPAWYPYVHNGIGALEFTGNDYLLAVDALPLSASYTKTAWVYAYSSGFNNIMSSSIFAANNHTFKLNPDMSLNAGHSNGDAIVSSDETNVYLSTGQWHFVAVSFDYESGEMAVFVDGAEADRQTVPAELMDVTDPSVLVGSLSKGFGFTGMIDEPRVFNYALSPEQISTLEADGNDIIRSEETEGSDEWYVDVTPFS